MLDVRAGAHGGSSTEEIKREQTERAIHSLIDSVSGSVKQRAGQKISEALSYLLGHSVSQNIN